MLEIIPISAYQDNYIWAIVNTSAKTCVIVDPGDALPVLNFLLQRQLSLSAILVTHHHADHTGGIAQLQQQETIPVYGPRAGHTPTVTHHLQEGNHVTLDTIGLTLRVIAVPGHTLDHIAYYNDQYLLCGDTLFSAGCGRLFEGTAKQMYNSLTKLTRLTDTTRVYCAHEYTLANLAFAHAVEPNNPVLLSYTAQAELCRQHAKPTLPSTIGLEKTINPFLRCHIPAVRRAAEIFAGQTGMDEIAVFTQLRTWKNTFAR